MNVMAKTQPFSLPALPYATNALEPVMSARTMEIHHGRHHAAPAGTTSPARARSHSRIRLAFHTRT